MHAEIYGNMKRFFLLATALMFFIPAVTAQVTDNYRPAGFDYNGASIKTFSVSDNEAVQFSRGNLQYNAAQNKWRFALRQYYSACNDNNNIAEDYDGWIDLFGWGTSGWNSGATAYQPWETINSYSAYAPGGDTENDLTGAYANADWGVYNKIENGGKCKGMWRTLTLDEWDYLLGYSSVRNNKWGLATIGGTFTGMVVLPDDWTLPDGLTFNSGRPNGFASNQYSLNDWNRMEAAGAVFLPAAGWRSPTTLHDVGANGSYWASTKYDAEYAEREIFKADLSQSGNNYRSYGFSVRLVRRVQTPLEGRAWVDMGLPSGTLWYSCNVGTTKPQGYGAYFAWGETRPKAEYSWDNYAYGTSETTLTKYCNDASYGLDGFTDGTMILEQSDDAARAVLGGDARIPSREEMQELIDNCIGEWTKYKGVSGCMLTSKVNGHRIFLPAAGYRSSNVTQLPGEDGRYWFSELSDRTPEDAWSFVFYENPSSNLFTRTKEEIRYEGLPIRAVRGGNPVTSKTFDGFGASTKTFSVAEGRTVHFSKGNLQYNAVQDTWRFAENQYDYVGADNSNISETYDGWIDLFGWGTSGWLSEAYAYYPWATSETAGDYWPGGSYENSLTGVYANADWGVNNAIQNGGNEAGMWRTLTSSECEYLLRTRSASTVGGTQNARYAKATIGSTAGLIIFPDSFTMPDGISDMVNINNSDAAFSGNTYSTEDWVKLESAGAIFLPAAGYRSGTGVDGIGTGGYYWLSTQSGEEAAWFIIFYDGYLDVNYYDRYLGHAVRLVKD